MYETNTLYSFILLEGSKQNVEITVEELNRNFTSISQETAEETARHRHWLQKDIGALHSPVPNNDITAAFRLATPAPLSRLSLPCIIKTLKDLTDPWRGRVTIILSHIDTRTVPEATAVVIWTANGTTQGLVGSLGNNRGIYFRIMRHFFYRDDATAFFQALTTHQVAPIPYQHKEQWSAEHSPLRLELKNQDPHRNGLGFGSAPDPFLVVGGFLPADDFSAMVRTNWIEASTILLRADAHGISPGFDADGQLTLSGFALYAAGVIDADLRPTTELTDGERRELGLNNSATVRAAMCLVMSNYHDWLIAALDHDFRGDPQSTRATRLRDHLRAVERWLIENPLMEAHDQAGGSISPSVEEPASAMDSNTLPPVEGLAQTAESAPPGSEVAPAVMQEPAEPVIESDGDEPKI